VTNSRTIVLAIALAFTGACAGPAPSGGVTAGGPPVVRARVVDRHARQFAEQVPRRPAGSQQEQIAATYILGHLQQAGYSARLDAVPVANLVRSTNVIAVPPEGRDPEILVAVSYDTPRERSGGEVSIGLFLEISRALAVSAPEHQIEFVALGAEHAEAGGRNLGARRMAKLLLDEKQDPLVVVLGEVTQGGHRIAAEGAGAEAIRSLGRASKTVGEDGADQKGSLPEPDELRTGGVFEAAGLDALVVAGDERALSRTLLDFLTERTE
jgi:hypothetical protein